VSRFAEGYRVALIARGRDFLEELAAEIKARGGEALAVPANVADASEIETAFASIRLRAGPPAPLDSAGVVRHVCRGRPLARVCGGLLLDSAG
jgi:NADP-dependent 3-hydroxy acid dehydrogenase YdfG